MRHLEPWRRALPAVSLDVEGTVSASIRKRVRDRQTNKSETETEIETETEFMQMKDENTETTVILASLLQPTHRADSRTRLPFLVLPNAA